MKRYYTKENIAKLEQFLADPEYAGKKSVGEGKALLLKHTFFTPYLFLESAGYMSHYIEPVWDAIFDALKCGWSVRALAQILEGAYHLQDRRLHEEETEDVYGQWPMEEPLVPSSVDCVFLKNEELMASFSSIRHHWLAPAGKFHEDSRRVNGLWKES